MRGIKTVLAAALTVMLLGSSGGTYALYAAGNNGGIGAAGVTIVANTAASGNVNDASKSASSTAGVKQLTIEQALQLAEENNTKLKQLKIAYDKAIVENEKAHDQARAIKDKYLDMNLDLAMAKYVNSKSKDLGEQKAQRNYQAGKALVLLGIRQKYYAVLENLDIVNSKKAALQRAETQLKNAEAAYRAGTVAKNDVLQAQVGQATAKAELTAAENSYRKAIIDLNKELGLPADTQLLLTSVVKMESPASISEQEMEQIIKQRLDVQNAAADLEITREIYDTVSGYTAPNTYGARSAKADMQAAQAQYDELLRSVKGEIQKGYLDLQAARDSLAAYDKAVEFARESLRLTELRYKVGVATSLDVITASEKLASTEASRIGALYRYNLAKMTCDVLKITSTSSTGSSY